MSDLDGKRLTRHLWSGVVTIVAGLLLQTGAMFYWAGRVSARVEHLERTQVSIDSRVRDLEIHRP